MEEKVADTIFPPTPYYWQPAWGVTCGHVNTTELCLIFRAVPSVKIPNCCAKGESMSTYLLYCQCWEWLKSLHPPTSTLLGLANDLGNQSLPAVISPSPGHNAEGWSSWRHVDSIYFAFPCLYEAVFNLQHLNFSHVNNKKQLTVPRTDFPFTASVYHLKER